MSDLFTKWEWDEYFSPEFKEMATRMGKPCIDFSLSNGTVERLNSDILVRDDVRASYEIALMAELDCVEL
jgi:hypothetical protein